MNLQRHGVASHTAMREAPVVPHSHQVCAFVRFILVAVFTSVGSFWDPKHTERCHTESRFRPKTPGVTFLSNCFKDLQGYSEYKGHPVEGGMQGDSSKPLVLARSHRVQATTSGWTVQWFRLLELVDWENSASPSRLSLGIFVHPHGAKP